ncbi:MAG TPA: TRAM domain-containing protein [Candidatus Saccharimonadales bacterium]|nr:TRAM domain-containing protein [Candidatus Saccharimonadales bacterium]
MAAFIEILLLIAILAFLVLQSKGGLGDLLGRKRKIILDSCALIDGRVVELARNGFLADDLVIPQFVLNELQLLADGNDGHKRERARFGLDIAHELQDASFESKVMIDRTPFPEVPTTDDKLIHLAKKLQAYLYTTDYNLSKVAAVEAVGVLNINELSQSLRPIALPGETLAIKILQKGSNPNQGVGYLEDGTMIVVEGAARLTGKVVDVTVTRMHQTVAGKMVFGQVRDMRDREQSKPAHSASHQAAQKLQQQSRSAETPRQPQQHGQQSGQQQASQNQKTGLHQRLRGAPQPKQTGQSSAQTRRPLRKPVQ